MIHVKEMTPKEKELDKYIIGQGNAKKSVAIALRNRWRRQHVDESLREEIMPNNIILIGSTGVGKTEIARRLARLANAPFIKVEASKFTEVGYVGRDVESIVRDLTDISVAMLRNQRTAEVQAQAEALTEDRILDLLLPSLPHRRERDSEEEENSELAEKFDRTREKLREQLKEGKFEDSTVELEIPSDSFPMMQVFSPIGIEEMGLNIQEIFGGLVPKKVKKRKMPVSEARKIITQEEAQKLVDMEDVIKDAITWVEQSGIVFLDEIDKIAGENSGEGPDVSREGVQRDLLPVVEGSSVVTKYGMVKSDHILFIASGAFHSSKPSDLIPELQGRFPIRVELDNLTTKDFIRILTEPKNALTIQYTSLLATENITLEFTSDGIHEIAHIASEVNERTENIGARRLHTVMTLLLDEILYMSPQRRKKKIEITGEYVRNTLKDVVEDEDLSRYIL